MGLVDEDDIPDLDTLAAYGDVLDLEMPAEALTNEEKLQVLVDNAGVIRDAVVELANTCQYLPVERKAGKLYYIIIWLGFNFLVLLMIAWLDRHWT